MSLSVLTEMLGLGEDQQEAVLAWTGEQPGKTWTQEEAAALVERWQAEHPDNEQA
ncbi:hypothetical protein [Phytohabitans rumicis]|nr:hypothetical protein [Phytohabitans rumicis]